MSSFAETTIITLYNGHTATIKELYNLLNNTTDSSIEVLSVNNSNELVPSKLISVTKDDTPSTLLEITFNSNDFNYTCPIYISDDSLVGVTDGTLNDKTKLSLFKLPIFSILNKQLPIVQFSYNHPIKYCIKTINISIVNIDMYKISTESGNVLIGQNGCVVFTDENTVPLYTGDPLNLNLNEFGYI